MNLDYIFRRRSIRKYTDKPATDRQIKYILEAAMAAPSAHNFKPWRFIVIRDRETLDRIARVHPHARMLFQAPLGIVICGDISISPERWDQDCAAVTENILLALPIRRRVDRVSPAQR
ncbi:MAG: nitroreductase family protein [Candidatus Marinimicrobia bacterium]|nr:nitroreductase family protein [Candidatus Neomarinimicrobiota bacterium]